VDYDMRGFWKATGGRWAGGGAHFPDTWKTPYDTSFSNQSKYAKRGTPFAWMGEKLVDKRTGQIVFEEGGMVGRAGKGTKALMGRGLTAQQEKERHFAMREIAENGRLEKRGTAQAKLGYWAKIWNGLDAPVRQFNGAATRRWLEGKLPGPWSVDRLDRILPPKGAPPWHEPVNARPLMGKGKGFKGTRNLWAGVGPSGLQSGIRNLAAYVMDKFPGLSVSSTTGGTHAANSLHYSGQAVDLEHGSSFGYLNKASEWIKSSGLYQALAEGIHNPNLSVKDGKLVSSGFWGATTWADHIDHIHLGVTHPWTKAGFKENGGSGTTPSKEHTFKEDVPAVYKGCKTGSLNLPSSTPNSLKGSAKELHKRRREVAKYRDAAAYAKGKKRPGVAQALQHNITALQTRIHQLEQARVKARIERAKKKFTGKLGRQMGKLTGFEKPIAEAERGFNTQQQLVEQIVGLEPVEAQAPAMQLPPVPNLDGLDKAGREKAKETWEKQSREAERAYGKRREGEERTFAQTYADYVQNREGKGYGDLLAKAAGWRNTILRAERYAAGPWDKAKTLGGLEGNWEDKIISTAHEIKQDETFIAKVKERVADYHKGHPHEPLPDWLKKQLAESENMQNNQLPVLRFKERELRKVLGEGQGQFYPGKSRIRENPTPPMAGTGAFEEALENVQGIHWPGQHEVLKKLPLARKEGDFGGVIWDVQEQIEELGLKAGSALGNLTSSSIEWPEEDESSTSSPDDTARRERVEEMLREANQRNLIFERQKPIVDAFAASNFAGMFARGGTIAAGKWGIAGEAGPEIIQGPAQVFSNKDSAGMAGGGVSRIVVEDNRVRVFDRTDKEIEQVALRVNRQQGRTAKLSNPRAGMGV
jgi:hypothetical protein